MVKDACSPFNIATDWKQFAKAHKERESGPVTLPTNQPLWLWRVSTICSVALCVLAWSNIKTRRAEQKAKEKKSETHPT